MGVQIAVRNAEDEFSKITTLLGGREVFPHSPKTALDAHRMLAGGLPGKALLHLVDNLVVPHDAALLQRALGMSVRTVQRKKDADSLLNQEQSGRTWKFAEILAKAIDVFGSRREAEAWLEERALGLDGNRPIDLLSTPAGTELVETFLDRLAHGVYV
jgi:putative toxin-antitoxin system antitoxin component (TIGR02293 family)